jgi:hypothetical protein
MGENRSPVVVLEFPVPVFDADGDIYDLLW